MSDTTEATGGDEPEVHVRELPPGLGRLLADMLDSSTRFRMKGEPEAEGAPRAERPPLAEQAAKLQDLAARYSKSHDFACGDLVQFKPGLGSLKDEARQDVVLVFWRYLDQDNRADMARAAEQARKLGQNPVSDCDVAYVCEDGHCLIHLCADSAELEPRVIAAAAD